MPSVRRRVWLIPGLIASLALPGGALLAVPAATAAGLPDFTAVVDKVSPAVVNVSAIQQSDTLAGDSEAPPAASQQNGDDPYAEWYRRYFGAAPPPSGDDQEDDSGADADTSESLGSGFIISADGEVLTNYHVVENAQSVVVRLSDRRVLPAKVLGVDPQSDLALLKIAARKLPVAVIASAPVRPGQWVLAIGSPFGFDHSVTAGIVSAVGRSISGEQYVPYIQTDVPINPGNSGGPLFNLQGQVVAINSEIYSRTGGYQGVSFAIPIGLAMQVMQQLRAHGHVNRGWLGVDIVDVSPDLAASLHLSRPEGALVHEVMSGSPAARAGLKTGDVILAYNGLDLVSSEALPPLVGGTPVGRDVPLTVLRDGKQTTLRVRIGLLTAGDIGAAATDAATGEGFDRLGLAVRPLTESQRRQFRLRQGGIVVENVAEGAARRAGFKPGDVVVMVNGIAVINPAQFRQLEKQLPAGRPVPVLVKRPDETLFLPLEAGAG